MIRVVHLGNDPALGGVNRWLDAQLPRLDPAYQHMRRFVSPTTEAPPRLDAAIIVIHFTMSWRALPWLRNLRRLNRGAAVVLVEHSYSPAFERLYVPSVLRFRTMLRLAYGMVDRVVSVSHAQCDWLETFITNDADRPAKLRVIHPFTDIAPLRALPLPQRTGGSLRLCGYGRYAPQKGFDTLLDAMRLVPPEVATLRLVGLGPEEAALRAHAASLPHVSVEGPVAGPADLFGEIDAVAIPSRFEPFGCVAAEVRAAGRAMIVSNADGLNDHPVGAPRMRVPADKPVLLADAIKWLAAQDITTLGAAARDSIVGAEQRGATQWDALLHELAPHARFAEAA